MVFLLHEILLNRQHGSTPQNSVEEINFSYIKSM